VCEKETERERERGAYHDVADRDTALGNGRGDHGHERALTQVNVHVCSSGERDGVHGCGYA
jgi:hypothetical protein